MRKQLNAEGHDESQYLPKDEPIMNIFRIQHSAVKKEGESIKILSWLPDILFEKNVIDKRELNTAENIYKCWVATNQALGVSHRGMRIASIEIEGIPREPKDIYFALLSNLLPYQSKLCVWLVKEEPRESIVKHAVAIKSNIINALLQAKNIIDNYQNFVKIQPNRVTSSVTRIYVPQTRNSIVSETFGVN